MESLEDRVKKRMIQEYRWKAHGKTRNDEYKEALMKIRKENKLQELELFLHHNRSNISKQDFAAKLQEIEGLKMQLKLDSQNKTSA